jgi:hypothetical protein
MERLRALRTLAIPLLLAPAAAPADELTLFGGWRSGGSFVDAVNGTTRTLDPSGSFALAWDRPIDASRHVRVIVSHQSTQLPVDGGTSLPMRVTTGHIGGTVFFDGSVGRGGYVNGGLGLTVFSPSVPGWSGEVGLSAGLGIGYAWPLTQSIALRAEARGTLTLLNGDAALFCSGGCVVSLRGDAFTQLDLHVGLSFRF